MWIKVLVLGISLLLVIKNVSAIYEDQVGKFEWHKKYIGNPVFTYFDKTPRNLNLIVSTEKNILASLNVNTLEIKWRQLVQQDILFTHVDNEIITISGKEAPVVRGWDITSGYIKWEWLLGTSEPTINNTVFIIVNKKLAVMQFTPTEVITTLYKVNTGEKLNEISSIGVFDLSLCVSKNNMLSCLTTDQQLFVLEVVDNDVQTRYKDISGGWNDDIKIRQVNGPMPIVAVRDSKKVIYFRIQPDISSLPIKTTSTAVLSSHHADQGEEILSTDLQNEVLIFQNYKSDGTEIDRNEVAFDGIPIAVHGAVENRIKHILVQTKQQALVKIELGKGFTKVQSTREESLASVVSVEIVDLPMSEADAATEKEFGNKDGGILMMFIRRLINQSIQLKTFIVSLLGLTNPTTSSNDSLVRDTFGLNKLIVVATETGNLFGIENIHGNLVWKLHVNDLNPFKTNGAATFPLYFVRSSIYSPYPAQCAVLGQQDNGNGIIVSFNPISGSLVETTRLDYPVTQSSPIHLADNNFIKGFLLLDNNKIVHVYPESSLSVAKKAAPSIFLYLADPVHNVLQGFTLKVVNEQIIAVPTWTVDIGSDDTKIIAIVGKRDNEKVHSQGRVLGDRSVLYKYANPNLVAVLTLSYHPSHRSILNVYLLDVVSGQIVFATSHRRARNPIHVVHSENWLVYSWFSEKNRRTEMATLELYEGNSQANATAFTSLDLNHPPVLMPMVERQAYILPSHITFLRETITEKGITNKHILVGLASGGILELPWAYLDPRRTVTVTQEMREEGVILYVPELPLPPEAIINHNLSVLNAHAAHTAPSSLESTCLLFVYGLDHYYTRVAPSKTFDLLKDDFDYFTIILVLTVLTLASVVAKRLSAKKALKQAWK